jgi:hypothetical protein
MATIISLQEEKDKRARRGSLGEWLQVVDLLFAPPTSTSLLPTCIPEHLPTPRESTTSAECFRISVISEAIIHLNQSGMVVCRLLTELSKAEALLSSIREETHALALRKQSESLTNGDPALLAPHHAIILNGQDHSIAQAASMLAELQAQFNLAIHTLMVTLLNFRKPIAR